MAEVSNEIALRLMSLNPPDDKSTLVQVMAWCRQATSHYLSQCWPNSMSPYGITLGHNELTTMQVLQEPWRRMSVNCVIIDLSNCHMFGTEPSPEPMLIYYHLTIRITYMKNKMANILQMTFSYAFSGTKSLVFWFKFYWSFVSNQQ